MKPAAAPKLPEGAPWEKLDMPFRKTLTVSKEPSGSRLVLTGLSRTSPPRRRYNSARDACTRS